MGLFSEFSFVAVRSFPNGPGFVNTDFGRDLLFGDGLVLRIFALTSGNLLWLHTFVSNGPRFLNEDLGCEFMFWGGLILQMIACAFGSVELLLQAVCLQMGGNL